jgi:ribosomal protein S18 acetylase RimI-like enzyme
MAADAGRITIRHMAGAELGRIEEIDRSEHVTQEYAYRDGCLEARSVDLVVPTWSRSGAHEHSVEANLRAWQPILDRGGTLVGAFDGDGLAGFAIYRPHLAEGTANLAALYVSRSYRRRGVGSLLAEEVARLARADRARRLYVSATPSGSAVGFYRSHGFEPTDETDEALFRLEPQDIHMILEL